MGDFGSTLRSARERKGISLRHIANSTKISMSALEALERNDFGRLPGGIFSRSFVRAYADEVGLNPDETVAEFLKEAGETFEPPPPVAPEDTPLLPERSDPALDFRQSWRPASVPFRSWAATIILIGIPLAAGLVYVAMREAAPAPAAPPSADTPAVQQQAPAQPGSPPPQAAASPGGPIADLEPGQPMRLVLAPTSECWVSLTVDGQVKVSRLLAAGEREAHEIREGAILRVGDGGAIAFSINGRSSKPVGERGVPETIRITRDNFKEFLQ